MLLTLAVRGIVATKSELLERSRSRLQRNDLVENSYPSSSPWRAKFSYEMTANLNPDTLGKTVA
jgi:hypothetical protein